MVDDQGACLGFLGFIALVYFEDMNHEYRVQACGFSSKMKEKFVDYGSTEFRASITTVDSLQIKN